MPRPEWYAVAGGEKTEFRTYFTPDTTTSAKDWWAPSPTLLYSRVGYDGSPHFALAILERGWVEPLGAISPESLRNEGFDTLAEFRAHWAENRLTSARKGFRPLDKVNCWRVRLTDDIDECGRFLMAHLYGDYLEDR